MGAITLIKRKPSFFAPRCLARGVFFMGVSVRFNRLSAAFYSQYGAYGEILDNQKTIRFLRGIL